MMNAKVIGHNISLIQMTNIMNVEISGLGISIETAEVVLGEALDDVAREGSVYVYTENVPNYSDGGTETDISFTTDLPVSKCIWEIKCRRDEELYTVTKFTQGSEKQDKSDNDIAELEKKVKNLIDRNFNLARTLVNVTKALGNKSKDSGTISDSDFIMLMLAEEIYASGDDSDDADWDNEWDDYTHETFTVSWKGITADIGNSPAWCSMWHEIANEYGI